MNNNLRITAPRSQFGWYITHRGDQICLGCYRVHPWHQGWCTVPDVDLPPVSDVVAVPSDDAESVGSADTAVIEDSEAWLDFLDDEGLSQEEGSMTCSQDESESDTDSHGTSVSAQSPVPPSLE